MGFESGGFLDDIMEDLLYPQSKIESLKNYLALLFFYPILVIVVLPLSYLISFIIGLNGASQKRKCDACGKYKLNNVNSGHKFYWFCEDCLEEYWKVEGRFIRKMEKFAKSEAQE